MNDASDKPREWYITVSKLMSTVGVTPFKGAIHVIEKSYATKLEAENARLRESLQAATADWLEANAIRVAFQSEADALAEALEQSPELSEHACRAFVRVVLERYRKFKGQDTEGESSE